MSDNSFGDSSTFDDRKWERSYSGLAKAKDLPALSARPLFSLWMVGV